MHDLPLPPPGRSAGWPALSGSADAFAIARAAAGRRLLLLTATGLDAQRLHDEIAWFAPGLRVNLLADWETLPYDTLSPHPDLVSDRLAALYQSSQAQCDVLIVPVTTAMVRLAPVSYVAARTFFLQKGGRLDEKKLREQLTVAGYTHMSQVLSPGEFCLRGNLIDLFPMGSAVPYRIDLFDDEIESIRTFDPETQRTIYPVNDVRLLPAREFPLDDAARTAFRSRYRERFEGDPSRSRIYRDVSNGVAPPGIEYYLPLFFDGLATLADYLPADATVLLHHDVHAAAEAFWRDTKSRYDLFRGDAERPLLPPGEIFLTAEALFEALGGRAQVRLPAADAADGLPPLIIDRRAEDPLGALKRFVAGFAGRVLVVAESAGRRETLSQLMAEHGLRPGAVEGWAAFAAGDTSFAITAGPLAQGWLDAGGGGDTAIAVITEAELYAAQVRQTRRRDDARRNAEGMLRDLSELRADDPVVHESHGVGRYRGLITTDVGEGPAEFLHIEYAGGDTLYVPVSQLHVISRYTGGPPESAPWHKLGSGQWEKAKRRAAKAVRDTAAELLNLYAQRAAREGRAFPLAAHDYAAFAEGFGFEETPDQAAAIGAVLQDLTAGRPMDRLVCGDVGFGKTEVAMRAAFIALMAGYQVAVLVPTTLLAEQHFQNFSDRLAEWPIRVAELSRFRTAKEQAAALKGLEAGTIDLIIGTHRLVQKDVKFKNLGLVIIDEEHRFGVRQKEALKSLRAEVDVLTLTATPIPRTLAMSLEGLRDFSVIATAPQRRLAIKTLVVPYSEGHIREAVLRELKRGGQVYFLHNEVDTILHMRDKLAQMVPEARIGVAHGQMAERELEQVMRDFYHQRHNLLLCTTIIETGIDVPTANTILINRADRFGLAQLHQLRGRVGRSHHQAYAYLITAGDDGMTPAARKRLEAIQAMEELGSGFYLAMHDLEIRGAGEVLGDSQSGQMQEVGFGMYIEMLNAAVRSLKAGREPDLEAPLAVTTEIRLHVPALLPEDYCGDTHQRLILYKRLANCESDDALDQLHEELVDRFGQLPEPAQALLECHRLRLACSGLGIVKLDASEDALSLQFRGDTTVDPARLMELVQKHRGARFMGADRVRLPIPVVPLQERARMVRDLCRSLVAKVQGPNGIHVVSTRT
ncbi:MAG: transcription-repair coupling factor [Rhodocyclaceae bacterium]|nr:transcription-repair coupling factor [Rhodocyclaceae bacterium]